MGFQPLDGAGAGHPEIRQRAVVPQQIPIGLLVQLRNADTIFVCRDVLCHNVHRQLCKVEVGADACRCGDAGIGQHLPHHGHGKLVGAHVVIGQIARHINKNLVDGVGVDIRRGHIFEVGLVDLGGNVQIPLHPGWRNDVAQPQCRVCVQGVGIKRGAGKVIFAVLSPDCLFLPDGSLQPLGVDLPDTLDGFKQPRSAGYLVSFQGGRHRKADGFLGAGGVRYHQIGGQGVQMTVYALHRGIEAFQVDCQIGALHCHDSALLYAKTTIYFIIINLYAVFKMERYFICEKISAINQTRPTSHGHNPHHPYRGQENNSICCTARPPSSFHPKRQYQIMSTSLFRPSADRFPGISSCTKETCAAKQYAQYIFSYRIQKWPFSS